ncbi:MAG: transcription antitermination factor NusB, partial [bacterium]|nr:transcription antitermination factor NusB [bacterium]
MSRRNAREVAFQTLFQLDVGFANVDEAFSYALELTPLLEKDRQFALDLVIQACAQWEKTNELVEHFLVDWTIDRAARVDISIIRL